MQYAQILEHVHQLPLGHVYYTYEWVGKPFWPVRVREGIPLWALPWRLIEVFFDFDYLERICLRADGGYLVTALLGHAWWKISTFLAHFKARLILTLIIWGIGNLPPRGTLLDWCHLKKRPTRT